MTGERVLLVFDDSVARGWAPFAATRPVGELLFGTMLLRERTERATGLRCAGHLAGDPLAGWDEDGAPPALPHPEPGDGPPRVYLLSRFAPRGGAPVELPAAAVLRHDDGVVGWAVPAGAEGPPPEALAEPDGGWAPAGAVEVRLGGTLLARPWHLVAANAERVLRDLADRTGDSPAPEGVHVLGDHALTLGAGAAVEPGVVLDLRHGPVRLEAGARVQGPARIVGPTWIGSESVVFGGVLEEVSVGPVCKVRGEIEASVVTAYCNKAHDGYLGHALLGRWVNLGAFTTNSDLKNSYSAVRVPTGPDQEVDTGLLKVGCFLGDHVKTGIGTLLNTGTVLGAGSNVFGGAMPPKWVPPFSWGTGEELVEYRRDKFLEVAEAAMARRGVDLTPGMREVLARVSR